MQRRSFLLTLGALAADVMSSAVLRAATEATSLPTVPALRDLGRMSGPPRP